MVVALLAVLALALAPGLGSAADLAFLSFDSQETMAFNLAFKQYIASYKNSKDLNQEKGVKSIANAIAEFETLMTKAGKQGADEATMGRLTAAKGLLIQAQGLIHQGRGEEAKELSVPIRTELYELHRGLGLLSTEDAMLMFHNGLMHRTEPLIEEGRYMELEMLLPRIQQTAAQFKTAPKGATANYQELYEAFQKKLAAYGETIKQLNTYVDPEYGAFMLKGNIEEAHNGAHGAFGKLYLSFPEGVGWAGKK
jgi:hypothetical protein